MDNPRHNKINHPAIPTQQTTTKIIKTDSKHPHRPALHDLKIPPKLPSLERNSQGRIRRISHSIDDLALRCLVHSTSRQPFRSSPNHKELLHHPRISALYQDNLLKARIPPRSKLPIIHLQSTLPSPSSLKNTPIRSRHLLPPKKNDHLATPPHPLPPNIEKPYHQ
jgi:hypothetical protein